ncbi:AMP-binding protein [Rhodoplanes sp. TEM]|uniref:AMP-binding protein n=1 Tax=Rhodoplanes tepidamans TaxID=200616 RepID=A0ABT5JHP9_RHOTP|nr:MULTISPECIES: AMP-binding protein [Rhodoplanes]MDC7789238.1 AMP-binding protein [Rhodoplanes tepidamans]MDC7985824.1 AMP-binding protein [Rhodoplanes sp. TEM]MDQ0358849.1 non-ribosomal peptide synthetase component E (peptide arylation enzyme) [Rhodoplanes tepidamans]
MILGDTSPDELLQAQHAGRVTLDDLIARAIAKSPDAVALVDAAHRTTTCGGAPLRLTWAEVDRAVAAIAARLRSLGLATDAVVALHGPNTAEQVLALLGVLRAGMIAAPLPLLWRRAELAQALDRVSAKAIVAGGRVGDTRLVDVAMTAAADCFTVRTVCGFGPDLPDGMVPLDPVLAAPPAAPVPVVERPVNPAAHVAVVTFDTDLGGPVAVGRNHVELLAAGLSIALECRMEHATTVVSTLQPSSLAGLSTGLVPWLLLGGTLALHPPFDAAVLGDQLAALDGRVLALPGPLAQRLAEAGVLGRAAGLKSVIAVWRTPERLAAAADWTTAGCALVDLQVFGETGLIAARRGPDGRPAAITAGAVTAPRTTPGATLVAEIARSELGTLKIRGSMVPRHPFPPGAARGNAPFLQVGPDLYVDTRQPCRVEKGAGILTVTAPPSGFVSIGGYRVALSEIERVTDDIAPGTTLLALPDILMGQRLFGHAGHGEETRAALAERGISPLVVAAFRDRRGAAESAAA